MHFHCHVVFWIFQLRPVTSCCISFTLQIAKAGSRWVRFGLKHMHSEQETAPINKDLMNCDHWMLSLTMHGWLTGNLFREPLRQLQSVMLVKLLYTCGKYLSPCSRYFHVFSTCQYLFTIYGHAPGCQYAAGPFTLSKCGKRWFPPWWTATKLIPLFPGLCLAAAVKDIKSWCLILLVLQTWHRLLAPW